MMTDESSEAYSAGFRYPFFGSCLLSEIPLPLPDSACFSTTPQHDIYRLALAAVPDQLPNAIDGNRFLQVDRDGNVLIRRAGIARCLVRSSGTMEVEPVLPASHPAVHHLILGAAAGQLMIHDRALVLRASGVIIRGKAMLLTGVAASGKSTLAAALIRTGATFLQDGLCIVRQSDNTAYAMAGPPWMGLWPDALHHFDYAVDTSETLGPGCQKRLMPMVTAGANAPVGCIVRLGHEPAADEVRISPTRGFASVLPPETMLYQSRFSAALGIQSSQLEMLVRLARDVPVLAVEIPRKWQYLRRAADELLEYSEALW